MQVKSILMPNKPHLDPIVSLYLLRKYGQSQFPGIEQAKIIFWEQSNDPTNDEVKRFRNSGVLILDVGGSLFDHHEKARGVKETTTSLVASYLRIESNPEVGALLNYIREDDLEGLHNRYGELAYLLKCMHKQNIPSEKVVEVSLKLINIFQNCQLEWHINTKKEYEEKCKIYKIKRFNKKLKVGIIESDNLQIANFGITADNLSVIVQKRSSGHVMILTNKNHHIDLREIIAAIRKRELELSGYDKIIDMEKLQFEGKSNLIPNWFYHRSLNAFLNGSDALVRAEPTKVSFKEIVGFVWYGLSSENSEYCDCDRGGESCPFAPYGFSKCEERKQEAGRMNNELGIRNQ